MFITKLSIEDHNKILSALMQDNQPTELSSLFVKNSIESVPAETVVMPNEVIAGGNIEKFLTKGNTPEIAGVYLIKNKYGYKVDKWNKERKSWWSSNLYDVDKYLFLEKTKPISA